LHLQAAPGGTGTPRRLRGIPERTLLLSRRLQELLLVGGVALLDGSIALLETAGLLPDWEGSRRVTIVLSLVFMVLATGGAWALGAYVYTRRAYLAQVEERAELAERERDQLARLHAVEERAAVARELHDVVAPTVSVMTVQAAAARVALRARPESAEAAIRGVEDAGRRSRRGRHRRARGGVTGWSALRNALKAIAENRLRSGLTMLGVIIGTGSVILLVAVGNAAQVGVARQLEDLGTNLISVFRARRRARAATGSRA
jgi:hypothetical protein